MLPLLLTTALAAEPITAPFGLPATATGEPFEHCLVFGNARKGRQRHAVTSEDGKVGMRCAERGKKSVEVCLRLDPKNWPTRFPEELSCDVGKRTFVVQPYVAWDPAWSLGEPLRIRRTGREFMHLRFRLADRWTSAAITSADARIACTVPSPGVLYVTTEVATSWGDHTCTLVDDAGTKERVTISIEEAVLPGAR